MVSGNANCHLARRDSYPPTAVTLSRIINAALLCIVMPAARYGLLIYGRGGF
jgi:hypothetical protein